MNMDQRLIVALTPSAWRKIGHATQGHSWSKALSDKIESAIRTVKSGNYDAGEPLVEVEGKIGSWISVRDAVSSTDAAILFLPVTAALKQIELGSS